MPQETVTEVRTEEKREEDDHVPDEEGANEGDQPRLSVATLVADLTSGFPSHGRSSSTAKDQWVAQKAHDTKSHDENDKKVNDSEVDTPKDKYLKGLSLVLVTIGFLLADFVASLDQSMVATALPKLASEFNALDQLTWVVSAFFRTSPFHRVMIKAKRAPIVTEAGAILTLGQILTIAPSKWVFAVCFVLFKIASVICALAPALNVLIFGRTLQGTNCQYGNLTLIDTPQGIAVSGGLISVVTMISQVARLEVRAIVFGSFAAVSAVSSVAGPMLGGKPCS